MRRCLRMRPRSRRFGARPAVMIWPSARVAAAYNLLPVTGGRHAGWIAVDEGLPVGFVLTSVVKDDPLASSPEMGWIDAIAVAPDHQGQGIGGELLRRAEAWLTEQDCTRWLVGAGIRTFAPGLPTTLPSLDFFRATGLSLPSRLRARLGCRP